MELSRLLIRLSDHIPPSSHAFGQLHRLFAFIVKISTADKSPNPVPAFQTPLLDQMHLHPLASGFHPREAGSTGALTGPRQPFRFSLPLFQAE